MKHMGQVRVPNWVGILQVQLTNSFFYITLLNSGLLSLTAWAAIGPSLQGVIPWARFWMFGILAFFIVSIVMFLDYKFVYPTRQRFINEQACKHTNPAMEELWKISKQLNELEKRLKRYEDNSNSIPSGSGPTISKPGSHTPNG
jgi:hypothetical protein